MKRWILIGLAALLLCTSAACGKKETAETQNAQVTEQAELGKKYLSAGQYEDAINAFRLAADSGEADAEIYLGLYEAYAGLDNMEEAVNALEEGYEATKSGAIAELYAEKLAELANTYMEDDEYEDAAALYEKLLAVDPENLDNYWTLYDIYNQLDEYELAVGALEQGYKATNDEDLKDSWSSETLYLAQNYLEEEDYESAVASLKKLVDAGIGDTEVYSDLADAYAGMYNYEEALAALDAAPDQEDSEIKSAYGRVKTGMAQMSYDDGDNEKAVSLLKEVIGTSPDSIGAYTLLANIYMESDNLSEAGKIVESGVSRFLTADADTNSEDFNNFLNIAVDYYTSQDNLEACEAFLNKAAALRPNDESFKDTLEGTRSTMADEAYAKAEELLEAGNAAGASVYFKKAFSLSPSGFEAGLYEVGDGTYYLKADGSYLTGWYTADGGEKFYFSTASGNSYGRALEGWQQIDGSTYYFAEGGSMVMDDTAPDGRYLGEDGRLTDMVAEATDEEEEDYQESEESSDEEEESKPAAPSNSQSETSAAAKPSGQTTGSSAVGAGKNAIKLDTDVLRKVKDSGKSQTVASAEIFGVSGSARISLNDIYTSLEKYGPAVSWISQDQPYEIAMGDLVLYIIPGDKWSETVVVQNAADYKSALFAKSLPQDFNVIVQFKDEIVSGSSRVDIDSVEQINLK